MSGRRVAVATLAGMVGVACLALVGWLGWRMPASQDASAARPGPAAPDNPLGQARWFNAVRAYPFDAIPPGARLKALAQGAQLLAANRASGVINRKSAMAAVSLSPWRPIGPRPALFSPATGNSGRATAVAIHPTQPNVIYLGTSNGGISKTTDSGATWLPLTDNLPSLATGSLAVDPVDPNVVYFGSGECSSYGDSYFGAGLFRSTNAGASWQLLADFPFTRTQVTNGSYVCAVAINPRNRDHLLVGTIGGIYRSDDRGATWRLVLQTETRSLSTRAKSIAFDPANPQVAYATTFTGLLLSDTEDVGIGAWKSTDGGSTWSRLTGAGSASLPLGGVLKAHLAIDPGNTSTLYLGVLMLAGLEDRLYKSVDGGATWARMPPTLSWGSSGGFGFLAVHPRNPNVLIAGRQLLLRSLDGGATWAYVGGAFHVDHHDIAFSSDATRMYLMTDGGPFVASGIDAPSVPSWTNLNATLDTINFHPGLAMDQASGATWVGTQDSGLLIYSGAPAWPAPRGAACGDGGFNAVDYQNPQVVYITCNQGSTSWVYKTIDGGATWTTAGNGIPGPAGGVYAPIAMDPVNPQSLLFATTQGVIHRTTDGAASWSAVGSFPGPVYALAFAPSNPNTVYAADFYGIAKVTDNIGAGAGATWRNITPGLPRLSASKIAVDPAHANVAYIAFWGFGGGHLFKTSDAGQTWLDISGGLPDTPVSDVLVDPHLLNTLYIATDVGVFMTNDGGQTWTAPGTGLPNVVAMTMGFHKATRTLRVATRGRSAWDLQVPTVASLALAATPQAVAFGDQPIGAASPARRVTVYNNGRSGPLALTISLAGNFAQSNNCGSSLAPASSCSVDLTFSPSALGAAAGTLTIASAAATTAVPVSANAVAAPAPTVNLVASASTLTAGQSLTLSWTTSNATSCTASGGAAGDGWAGARAASGNATITPPAAGAYSYSIQCTGGGGSATAQASATVSAAASGGSGGGAVDGWTLLALALAALGLRQLGRGSLAADAGAAIGRRAGRAAHP
jgi:photosystem II stability/assembly factor-like uncharacterized protein